MTGPATDRSMITTTHRSGTETGNSSGGRAARQNSGPDGVRREPPSSAGKPLHGAVLLAALGIVYGDIGTSPIYTFRECLKAGSDGEVVLGLLSLIFWSLTIVVTTKYVLFVMRADNHGEGGIMALLGLAAHSEPDLKRRSALILLGIAGAALFYGDGMITPAISVLSAVEGLKVATPVLAPYVVPISLVVLLGLFLLQRSGSDRIGRYFGPVMGLWFLALAISGLVQIIQSPSVLAALNPVHALSFLAQHGATGFVALGSVFLALTGAEALYADMGHFGRAPIRVDWFGIVLPALVLNYFGQGALVLAHPDAADSPFLSPVSGLAAVSDDAIGDRSDGDRVTSRYLRRLLAFAAGHAVESSAPAGRASDIRKSIGQVYVPQINWLLALGVIGLVLGFQSSEALAAAYGIAVVITMLVTTALLAVVARRIVGLE